MALATVCGVVNVAQGHDFPHMMVRIEATLLQLEVIGLRPRGEGEKAQEELMIARFFALLQQWLRVIGSSTSWNRS